MTATWCDPTATWADPDVTWDGTAPDAPATTTCPECWALVLSENEQAHADWHRDPRQVTVIP